MKRILKGIFIPLVVSLVCGFVCAKLVYRVYGEKVSNKLESSKLYLIEGGKYLTYDNMREENNGNNYVYYKDDDGYKTVIGITKSLENIDKIKSLYNEDVSVLEYYVSNALLNDKQNEYDVILSNTDDIYEVKEIVDNILNLYREEDSVKLLLVE